MKKLICTGLSVAMMMSGVVFARERNSFSDLESVEWAAPYIEDMAEQGFISGYEDGTFRPNNDVTHLEGLVLFARAMGSNSEAIAKITEYAVEQYGDLVDEYNLSFGKNEICYMLYRGALTEKELDDYISEEIRNEPMKRYEAAIVITKALVGEKEAKSEMFVDTSYSDAQDIPAKATQYVYYVTENNIMNGMEDNKFSPNTNVKRSQIAVMLSRAVDAMGISFSDTVIERVNTSDGLIETEDGAYEYNSDTMMNKEGVRVDASDMPENVAGIITMVRDEVVYVDALASEPDKEISGIYNDHFLSNGVLNIQLKPSGSSKTEYYEGAEGIRVTRNGESSSLADFKKGDYITLKLSNGKVVMVSAEQQTVYVTDAIISDIRIDDDLIVTIEHEDEEYDGAQLNISNDVIVTKNGAVKSLADIYRGDKVTLTMEYGQVTKIVATSTKKTVNGIIREIHISQAPYMVIDVNGEEIKYDIPASISIKVNGENGTIYDFKLGDTVKITIESQAITSISVTSVQSGTKSITAGTVTANNTSYGFIKVSYDLDGVTREETVMCKDNTTTVLDAAGKSSTLKGIKEGDIVTIRGTVTNGAFVASVILIEAR